MATSREYAYYLKGNKIAIVERDYNDASGLTSPSSAPSIDLPNAYAKWKSPVSAITDGIEIEYAYSPKYFIESTDVSTTTASGWDQDNDGNFRLRAAGGTDWTSSPNLSAVKYIVLENAGRFNGLHEVSLVQSTRIVTTTKVSASTSNTDFERTVTLYYDVNVLNDESDTIDLPPYLSRALVLYVKGQLAEDQGDVKMKEYFMKEFRRMVEKDASSKVWAARMISSGPYAIR